MPRRLLPLLGLVALLAAGCSGGEEAAEVAPPVGTEEGQRAPELRGTTSAGEPFSLDGAGTPVVVVFYPGAYCGLCRDRLRRLQDHLAAYGALGAFNHSLWTLTYMQLHRPFERRGWDSNPRSA